MDTNTVQLIEAVGSKLDSYIQVIASKAGVAADHFYPLFVRQQVVEGYSTLALCLIGVVGCLLFLRLAFKNLPIANSDSKSDVVGPAIGKCVIGFIFGGFLLLAVVCNVPLVTQAVGKVCNPEYAAVQSLVNMVK